MGCGFLIAVPCRGLYLRDLGAWLGDCLQMAWNGSYERGRIPILVFGNELEQGRAIPIQRTHEVSNPRSKSHVIVSAPSYPTPPAPTAACDTRRTGGRAS